MSDHCEILRVWDMIATLIWVTARTSLGTTALIQHEVFLKATIFTRNISAWIRLQTPWNVRRKCVVWNKAFPGRHFEDFVLQVIREKFGCRDLPYHGMTWLTYNLKQLWRCWLVKISLLGHKVNWGRMSRQNVFQTGNRWKFLCLLHEWRLWLLLRNRRICCKAWRIIFQFLS